MVVKFRTVPAEARILAGILAFGLTASMAGIQTASAQDERAPVYANTPVSAPAKPTATVKSSARKATGAATTVAAISPQAAPRRAAAPKTVAETSIAKPFYIEFRSRSAQSYGHTFSMSGKMDAQGRILTREVIGLHPFTESPIPWMIGHLVVVPSETGPSDGDYEDEYVTARFRIALTEAEYIKVMGFVRQLRAKSPLWHAVLYNCNAFVGDIAHFMGMETPMSTMIYPENYISGIRDLNINRSTAHMIGTPVKVEDAETLRGIALREKKTGGKTSVAPIVAESEMVGVTSQSGQPEATPAATPYVTNQSW